MAKLDGTTIDPPRLRPHRSHWGLFYLSALGAAIMLAGFIWWFFWSSNPLIGVWKGTDIYGGEHYYEFHEGRRVVWWDIERTSLDSPPEKRGPFEGIYYYEQDKIIAKGHGLLAPRVGVLRWQGPNELKQDEGYLIRQYLSYRRVGGVRVE